MTEHCTKQDPNLLAHLGQFTLPSADEPDWFPPMKVWQSPANVINSTGKLFAIKIQWDTLVDEDYRQMRMFDPRTGDFIVFEWRGERRINSLARLVGVQKYCYQGRSYASLAEAAYDFLKERGGL